MPVRIVLLISVIVLSSCSQLQPYTFDIQQGNIIDDTQVAQVKIGMTPSQVTFILGSPAIKDPFTKDRWDYVYHIADNDRNIEKKRVSIFFQSGSVSEIITSS